MGLLTLPFRLPLLPLKGFIRLGEMIAEQTERELRDPARVRRELEEAQWQQAQGAISEEDAARIQEQAISTLVRREIPSVTRADEDGS